MAKKVHDDANVAAVVETVPEVDTAIAVFVIVGLECCENSEFYSRGISIFLHRSDNLDGNGLVPLTVSSLDDFAKCPLPE